jgi:pilus assembly protein TadC
MTGPVIAALLLALAVLVRPGRALITARLAALGHTADPTSTTEPGIGRGVGDNRRGWRPGLPAFAALGVGLLPVAFGGWPGGFGWGLVLGIAAHFGSRWFLRSSPAARRARAPDPLRLASGWDLLSACLRAGLSVPLAVQAVSTEVPAAAAEALRRTADLLALGADPVSAWAPALAEPLTAELARGARRSARSGTALAGVAEGLAVAVRAGADDLAEARAQRAAVAVTGPLGLCFLPAFLCVGVVPVVIGLATRLTASWQ